MAKNSMDDLRNHLFLAIEKLQSNNDPKASACEKIDLKTAKQIADTASVIIDSVKVEVDFLKVLSNAQNRDTVISAASNMLPNAEHKAIA